MIPEEVLLKAQRAQECAVKAADAIGEFIDHLKDENARTSDAAAHAYMKAVGHLNDALAVLNELGARQSGADEGARNEQAEVPKAAVKAVEKGGKR